MSMRRLPGSLFAALALAGLAGLSGCHGNKGSGGPTGGRLSAADAPILNNNAVMLLEHDRGDPKGAAQLLQQAVSADPHYVIGFTNLGIAQYAASNYAEAIKALDTAEKLGGKTPNLYFARGLAKVKALDYAGGEKDLRVVVRMDGHDAFVRYHLGIVLGYQHQYPAAVESFKEAVKCLPTFKSAYYNMALDLRMMGKPEEGAKAQEAFSKLEKTGIMVGTTYFADEGKYLEPLHDTRVPKRAASGPMVSLAAAGGTGLDTVTYRWKPGEEPSFASAWGDYDSDGKPDLLLAQATKITLLHNEGGKFTPVANTGVTYPGSVFGACWGDYDNDSKEDVVLCGTKGVRVFRNLDGGRFQDATAQIGLNFGGKVNHAVWVDYDHDGFLDLFVVPDKAACVLYRNNGNGKFSDVSAKTGVTVAKGVYALPTDFDRNRAIDLLVVSEEGKHTLLRNNYNGTFSTAQDAAGLDKLGTCRQVAAADLNSDGLIDYVAATNEGVKVALHQPDNTFLIKPIVTGGPTPTITYSVNIADFDNDGNFDVVALAAKPVGMGSTWLRLYRGNGDGTFTDATAASGLDKTMGLKATSRLTVADADGNGFPDLFIPDANSMLFTNAGNANRWVRLTLHGLKVAPDPKKREGGRANGDGLGSMVEAWTDSTWETTEVTASAGNDAMPILGLGTGSNPRWLRILWPTGIHQCEPLGDQPEDKPSSALFKQVSEGVGVYMRNDGDNTYIGTLKVGKKGTTQVPVKMNTTWVCWEPDRTPTSCPVLYVWDGRHYRFVTDLQGGAIVGYNIGQYQYNANDPDEYVMIPGETFALRNGQYDVEIADQLQEVLFMDAVHLLAVDHPASTQVFSNDRMLAAPPWPRFAVWSVEQTRPLKAATDDTGANVLPLLANVDRNYPEHFRSLPYQGFTQKHTLTLDLGDTRGAKQVLLLLYGWQDYAHSSSNLAAAHAGLYGQSPSLQVKDRSGKWRTVLADMGSVAGLPKWLAVDLTPFVPLTTHDSRLTTQFRIVTNLALYWDRALVGLRYHDAPVRLTRLTPSRAEYHWLGYPTPTYPDGRDPVVYDYDHRRASAPWLVPAGWYTRPGDVTELLQKPDDRYVIMRHGYAMRVTFDPSRLPPLPSGWKRDFVLYSDGFGKDMDMNGAYCMTVGPLPFHGMTRYPYGPGEHYPTDRSHAEYQAKYNTVYEPGASAIARWPEMHK
jgi:hypothetical protein